MSEEVVIMKYFIIRVKEKNFVGKKEEQPEINTYLLHLILIKGIKGRDR